MLFLKDLLNYFKNDIEKETLFNEIILELKIIVSQKDISNSFLEEKQKKIEEIILKKFFHTIKYGVNFSKIVSPKVFHLNKKNSSNFEDFIATNEKYLKIYTDFSFMLEKLIHDNKNKSLNVFIIYNLIYVRLNSKHFFPYILLKFLSDEFYSFLSFNEKQENIFEKVKSEFNSLKIDYNKAFANLLFLLKYNLYFLVSKGFFKDNNSFVFLKESVDLYKKNTKLSKQDKITLSF
jgi:hypothetical protein